MAETPTQSANAYEDRAREEKCRKIVRAVMADAVNVLTRDIANERMWKKLAETAGVNIPSDVSRRRIIEIIGGLG